MTDAHLIQGEGDCQRTSHGYNHLLRGRHGSGSTARQLAPCPQVLPDGPGTVLSGAYETSHPAPCVLCRSSRQAMDAFCPDRPHLTEKWFGLKPVGCKQQMVQLTDDGRAGRSGLVEVHVGENLTVLAGVIFPARLHDIIGQEPPRLRLVFPENDDPETCEQRQLATCASESVQALPTSCIRESVRRHYKPI